MPFKLTLIAILSSLLYGCATLNESECKADTWESIGYQDGSKGKEATRLAKHVKACARFNVPPNRPQYLAGHQRGLEDFCIPELAFNRGKRSSGAHAVCPFSQFPKMQPAYDAGYEIFLDKEILEQEIDDIRFEMSDLTDQLDHHQHELNHYRAELSDRKRTDSDKDQKNRSHHDHSHLRRLMHQAERKIDWINFQRRPFINEIRSIEHEIRQLNNIPMPARFR